MKLKGSEVAVPRETLPEPDDGSYYWSDLVGLAVVNTRGESLGAVKEMFSNGAQDVIDAVDGEAGEVKRLIPWTAVQSVDLESRRIEVEWRRTGESMIRFDAITLFPEMFAAVTQSGITSRALEKGLWQFNAWNPRDFTTDNYRTIDDRPYGGGPGMVMLAGPLEQAIAAAKAAGGGRVIYLSPQGARLDHKKVMGLAAEPAVTLLCGRYEGIDER